MTKVVFDSWALVCLPLALLTCTFLILSHTPEHKFSVYFSLYITTFTAIAHSTVQRTVQDNPEKDFWYFKGHFLDVAISYSGRTCLQEWIVKANSSSKIPHYRTGSKMPKKWRMLDKALIRIRPCFVYSTGFHIRAVREKKLPNRSLIWNFHV